MQYDSITFIEPGAFNTLTALIRLLVLCVLCREYCQIEYDFMIYRDLYIVYLTAVWPGIFSGLTSLTYLCEIIAHKLTHGDFIQQKYFMQVIKWKFTHDNCS